MRVLSIGSSGRFLMCSLNVPYARLPIKVDGRLFAIIYSDGLTAGDAYVAGELARALWARFLRKSRRQPVHEAANMVHDASRLMLVIDGTVVRHVVAPAVLEEMKLLRRFG